MATYRCLSCGGIYVDPQPPGVRYFHACPPQIRDAVGELIDTPAPRDENIVQLHVQGKDSLDGRPLPPGEPLTKMAQRGKGRVKLSEADVLTGATPAQLLALQQQAGVRVPDP